MRILIAAFLACMTLTAHAQLDTKGLPLSGGTIDGSLSVSGESIFNNNAYLWKSGIYPQYSFFLRFQSGSDSSTVFNLDNDGLQLRHNGADASKIVTLAMLTDGSITNGLQVGTNSFVLDTSGNLAADWNLGGHTISDGVFVGDGSGLTGVSGGGLEALGSPATGKAPVWKPDPYTNGVWTYVPYFDTLPTTGEPVTVWWHPDVQQWGLSQPYAYSQAPINTNLSVIGTNVAIYRFSGETNYFVVPTGVSNLLVKLWGSAGANENTASRGGLGGYASGYLAVTQGETLAVAVGGGVGYSYKSGAFGGGGRSKDIGGGGGGASYLKRDTNVLCVAGGGGGAYVTVYGGGGGGLSGDAGAGTVKPGGGTQSEGGAGVPTGSGRDGSFMSGGAGNYGGGGGGYYGGGGADNYYGTGGGGSSYIGGLSYAVTYSSNMTSDEDYEAGVGARSASTYSHGGPGLIVIRW